MMSSISRPTRKLLVKVSMHTTTKHNGERERKREGCGYSPNHVDR